MPHEKQPDKKLNSNVSLKQYLEAKISGQRVDLPNIIIGSAAVIGTMLALSVQDTSGSRLVNDRKKILQEAQQQGGGRCF